MDEINAKGEMPIILRQVKYLNNIVEQDHRAIKRVTRPMLNFKSFRCAGCVLAGVELMHMIRKGQMNCPIATEPYRGRHRTRTGSTDKVTMAPSAYTRSVEASTLMSMPASCST